ncbi:ABC-2 type transport system permease protein [Methylohalomonas lacus]|uniref:Transport permease protein n=1 Tax=Methylohalomonas lacus TaxID=398773 RepID=A0AAE3HL19_9GAMM|nr:ABC transporter permease [Methylohalomonas lacus]MCS3902413.1 ABC-2 type transport system permease protein [Methylohalomonas lacus]
MNDQFIAHIGDNCRASCGRIYAIILRYVYLLRGSWPRMLEQAYWPTVQMIIWGFITQFFMTNSDWVAQATGVLLSAVLLWDVLFRAQLGVSVAFMEELFARNLGHLFASPLRPQELILALLSISLLRTLLGVGTAALLAIPLYHISIFDLGLPLIAFFTCLLVFGWSVGLVISSLLLRYGLGVESLAWASIFALAPISAIYYPVTVLPDWLQPAAWALPTSHVFEGMRKVLFDGVFDWTLLLNAVGLNVFYLLLGSWIFYRTFQAARRRGLLLQMGE